MTPTPTQPHHIRMIGFWLGIGLFITMALLPPPSGLEPSGWLTLALLTWMVCWWVSEALPIGITSLLPLVIAPLLGLSSLSEAAAPFAHPIIFLLMGGYMIGKSIERWSLHERIALGVLSKTGTTPSKLIGGFMITAAGLSMWISNSATTIMLLPIILSIAARMDYTPPEAQRFTLAALLGVAWAASIGGLGTPVGTPPNLIVIGFLEASGDMRISFLRWMAFGLPVVLIMVPAGFIVLTRFGPKLPKASETPNRIFSQRLKALGPISRPERRVMSVFLFIAFFWMFRRIFINKITVFGVTPFANLSDSAIAIAGVIALFTMPAGVKEQPHSRLLDWDTAVNIPWDTLLLFGGGLSLAALIQLTGLSLWLGNEMSFITHFHPIIMTLILVSFVIFFTELTSNTATTAALMPIIAAIALETGLDPVRLAIPLALAGSCAFMLPMATGPNAVVFGSGKITMGDMAKAGFRLNLIGIPVITLIVSLIYPLVFSA